MLDVNIFKLIQDRHYAVFRVDVLDEGALNGAPVGTEVTRERFFSCVGPDVVTKVSGMVGGVGAEVALVHLRIQRVVVGSGNRRVGI